MTPLPLLYTVPFFDGLVIPGTSRSADFEWRWTKDDFVTGCLFFAESGATSEALRAATANLRLAISDETFERIVTDGQGLTFDAPGAALLGGVLPVGANGFGFRPFVLQRPVACGDVWVISMRNMAAAPVTVAGLYFYSSGFLRERAQALMPEKQIGVTLL